MASDFLGALSNIGEIVQGADRAGYNDTLRQIALMQMRQQQQQMQLLQQQQQGLGLAAQGIRNYNPPIPQAQPQSPPMAGGGFSPQSGMNPGMFGPGTLTPPGQVPLPQLTDEIFNLESSRGANPAASPAGARGPMQIMPATFSQYARPGQSIDNPADNKAVGDRIVGDLYSKYGGNPDLTAIAYNAGPGRADKIAGGAPLSSLPGETQNYLAKMHRDLDLNVGQAGVGLIQKGLPVPAVQESTSTAKAAGREIDPQQWGMASLHSMMAAIDKAAPDAPDAVKMIALGQLNKLVAPEERMQLQMYMKDNAQQLQVALANFRATAAEQRSQDATTRATTIETMREGAAAGRQERGAELKAAQGDQGQLDPQTLGTMADQYLAGDRSVMQNLGRGAQGSKNIVALRGEIAKKMAEGGMSGQDIATKMAEFEGLKSGERTLSQRTANIGMRINEAQRFAPLALDASDKVNRTQYKTFNQLENAWREGTGDENVVNMMVYMQSFMNAYAAAVTPTGQPTEGAQARARHNLDMAWSQGQVRTAIQAMLVEMDQASKSPGAVREEFRKGAAAPSAGGNPTTGPTSGGMPGYTAPNAPQPGTVEDGFVFQGGDPSDPKSWKPQ